MAAGLPSRFNWWREVVANNLIPKGATTMSMIERLRHRRDANRRTRAIERALREAKTPAVRDEILAIASRYYG
jgi:hypothetical protein